MWDWEVFQNRKMGFPTHPFPCGREWNGKIQAWGNFSNEIYRKGRERKSTYGKKHAWGSFVNER